MKKGKYDIIVIGGSAGSIPVIVSILDGLPTGFNTPIILVLHRQKNVTSEMSRIFQVRTKELIVSEPEDKEPILPAHIYLAPQNYHLLVEKDRSFSLDYSEPVHYSRPSIDVTFESVSNVYSAATLGILLSGANKDGTKGIETILANKGNALVQDPVTAEYPVMVNAAIEKNKNVIVYSPDQIIEYLSKIENA